MRLFLMIVVLLMVQYKTFGQCWNPDSNADGFINTSDLLSFLSVFDNPYASPCDTIPSQYNACVNQNFLEYNGYMYSLVAIGDQCWFAENLRTAQYRDGIGIAFITDNAAWSTIDEGAFSFVNEEYYVNYGSLYNWYAVNDSRKLCPLGWHVPSDGDWMMLEVELNMSFDDIISLGSRGDNQGAQLKASDSDSPGWDGSNSSGFSTLPSGYRGSSGNFYGVGNTAFFWSSSLKSSSAWSRYINSNDDIIYRTTNYLENGFSVRCVKD